MNREDLRRARGVLPYKSKDPVLPNPNATGQFLFITLRADLDQAGVRTFLGSLQAATTELQEEMREGHRVATVATGFSPTFFLDVNNAGVPRFGLSLVPAGLRTPPVVEGSQGVAADLLCYLVTTSEGCAARFIARLATDPAVAAVSLEHGFQRLDGSEPFGYRDGVRNIEVKADRPKVVFVDTDELPEEPWWAHDGTYLAYVKIQQDTAAMDALPQPAQDAAIGRTRNGYRLDADPNAPLDAKAEGEFSGDTPPVDSHVRKTGPRGAAHDTVRIFRRGLPYCEVVDGRVRQGLQFASFQATLDAFDVIFNRWMNNPNFPPGGPQNKDRLLQQNLIQVLRHGFYFVPPETDLPIGEVFFTAPPKTKVVKVGRVAVRKALRDAATNAQHKGELSGFTFALFDAANGAPVGGQFSTDGLGHALSDEVPVGQELVLREVTVPAGFSPAEEKRVTLQAARQVVPVENTVQAGTAY